ncbi:hypothetical protein SEA_WELCOME_99 [Microbacterium phage Welcome]|nr:hypothetical protein SEA_WELCOME_99 [Microbacterium phage Welcome]WNO25987.1 hypothetical protein SEA_ASEGATO_95 [Microbacterium phage ASegato]
MTVLDLGEVSLPSWRDEMGAQQAIAFREVESRHGGRAAYALQDINYVRTWIRKRLYGEHERADAYKVRPTWVNGESDSWEFGQEIGWPTVNGEVRDWHAEWMNNFGGVA